MCTNVNIFSVKEQGKENRKNTKSQQKYKEKVNKMFVNVHNQSTHDVFKSP